MNNFKLFAEKVYSLTCKYGSEYRTGNKSSLALQNAQMDFLLSNNRYCGINDNGRIDCSIPFLCGGEFNWTLSSWDNIVEAVRVLYENVYSQEADRVFALREERAKRWRGKKRVRSYRILDMQRLKRGEISHIPVRR